MDKIKISTAQCFMMGVSSITITGHLLFIPVILNRAGRDGWLSLILSIVPVLFIGFVVASLAGLYPRKTLTECAQLILGKWAGRGVAILFILFFFHETSLALRGFGEFFTTAITPHTPILIYFAALAVLAAYNVRCGLEVMVRTNQAFLTMMIFIGLSATILTLKNKDYANLLPILEFGPKPMLKGMLTIVSLFSTFFVLGMVFPFVHNIDHLKRFSLITMAILICMFIGPITGPIALFGIEHVIGLNFPTFQMLRDIQLGDLQRLDIIGILLWSFGSYAKISLFLFAVALGLQQLFGLKDYRLFVIPISALLVIVALLNSESYIEIYRFFRDTYPFYALFVAFFLPTLLLLIAYTKRLLLKRKGI
jgi:spore germination protein KB